MLKVIDSILVKLYGGKSNQSIIFLGLSYNNNRNESGQWIKMFFGLPFLLTHEVAEAFVDPYVHHKMHVLHSEITFLTTTLMEN